MKIEIPQQTMVKIADLKPYPKNTKKHTQTQIDNVAESIRQFGFVQPFVIDKNNEVVIGHCRLLAAQKLGIEELPCVYVDYLTKAQIKALRILDNKLNESEWDMDFLNEELPELDLTAFEIDWEQTAVYEEDYEEEKRIFEEKMARGEIDEGDEEYQAFLEKFEPKKTTDDCYTPDNIYEAVRKYATNKYGLQGRKVIRPFYPGGDYKKEKYPKGCVVIDNPPFSILAEIKEFYHERGVDYFLFAPTLTLFQGKSNFLITGTGIRYKNGAIVNTSFVTNLGEYRIEVCPDLCEEIERLNKENASKDKRELKAKDYPLELVTSARLGWLAKNGQTFKLRDAEVYFVRKLDEQKESAIYGGGFLISERAAAERAAAERAAAERFELSEREKEIVRSLGK